MRSNPNCGRHLHIGPDSCLAGDLHVQYRHEPRTLAYDTAEFVTHHRRGYDLLVKTSRTAVYQSILLLLHNKLLYRALNAGVLFCKYTAPVTIQLQRILMHRPMPYCTTASILYTVIILIDHTLPWAPRSGQCRRGGFPESADLMSL